MSKILDAFRKFKQDMHEIENAEKLQSISPMTTVYDICHQFAYKHQNTPNSVSLFESVLKKQPHVYHTALNHQAYDSENAHNQLILHGVLFNALFNVYMSHFKKGFDNIFLLTGALGNKFDENRPMICFTEYAKLPKRYRDIFVRYNCDNYTLNAPYTDMIIKYNKKNKSKLEKLLLRAKMLIPVLYKEKNSHYKVPEDDRVYLLNEAIPEPAFVPDSASAKCITDEQLNTVKELHDIFVEIAKITTPIQTNVAPETRDVFLEFKKEMEQKDIFVKASDAVKHAKAHHEESLANAEHVFNQKKQAIDTNYKHMREDLFEMLSEQTSVRIK